MIMFVYVCNHWAVTLFCVAAGGGTYLIEFGVLSYLTRDLTYYKIAKKATLALWERRPVVRACISSSLLSFFYFLLSVSPLLLF